MTKTIVVRRYGARLLGGEPAEQLELSVLRALNKLWNALVEVDRVAHEDYNKMLAANDPELQVLLQRHAAEETTLQTLYDERAKVRARLRKKSSDDEVAMQEKIQACIARLKALRTEIKPAKMRAKEAVKPQLKEAEDARRHAVRRVVAESGLWWTHSDLVLKRFELARTKAMKSGSTLRFHRFRGEGSFYVRFTAAWCLDHVMRGRTELLRISEPTVEDLGRAQASRKNGSRRVILAIQVGAKDEAGFIPKLRYLVTMHAGHELPLTIPAKTVTVTREMHVNKPERHIVFMFSQATEEKPVDPSCDLNRSVCGIDFGFRQVREEAADQAHSFGFRVCTVSYGPDQEPLHCILPSAWVARMEYADALRSRLDRSASQFQTEIRPFIGAAGLDALGVAQDSWLRVLCGKVSRAKGAYASLLMDLCRAHADEGSPLGDEVSALMKEWFPAALRLSLEAHHVQRKAIEHRKQVFRNFAAELVRESEVVALVDADFSEIAKLVDSNGGESPLPPPARRNRQWAAPSELRLAIMMAAHRKGRQVIEVPARSRTRTCHHCGHLNSAGLSDLIVVCSACGVAWDQDVNGAMNARCIALSGGDLHASA